jgi:Outer membrane protein beta-barrel domain
MRRSPRGCFLVLLLSCAAPAAAQSWPERVHVSLNAAFQTTSNDFSGRFEFERNLETGFTEADYRVQGGFVFDAGVGYRLWKNLGAGVSVSHFTRSDAAQTRSSVPHPFFFNQPREVTGDASGLNRTETAVHVQAMYMWNSDGPLRVIVSGGPSFFTVRQDVVTEVVIVEAFPFDTATFGSAQTSEESGSAVGFNVGADVMWMFGRSIGAGGLVRLARTTVDLDAPGSRTLPVDAGGVYAGGGIRFVF